MTDQIPRHCDDYIYDYRQPNCLRWFLLINRLPAVEKLLAETMGVKPQLYATWIRPKHRQRVRVVMASRFGDVGITTNLEAEHGYEARVPVESLTDFSDKP